ncbi:hypothetical protein EHQ52_11180 [Leptospira koniambonensis]|uniref:Uncharacterized protein n=1 Tax=Leptospira koniambonensis TaxID=2484950 RepID=A0A4R9J9W6_9LEPT|nr:hypothetical protein [Leptospira koniambonensis]TGL35038.1 hypothetical protein EHQ52_11180 [Leptospira koniambonensis]
MNAYRRLLLTAFIIFPFPFSYGAEKTIYLKGGVVVVGEVLEETEEYIKIKTANGIIGKLEKKFIENISELEQSPSQENTAVDVQKFEPIIQTTPETNEIIESSKKPSELQNEKTNLLKHKFEISLGIGYGSYQSTRDLVAFQLRHMGEVGLNGEENNIYVNGNRNNKPGLTASYEMNYYWKKISSSFSGSTFTGEARDFNQYILSSNLNLNTAAKHPFTNSQTFIKGDISYLTYSDNLFQIRPSLGYLQTWAKSPEHSSVMNPIYSSAFYINGLQKNIMFESMKGPLIGIKLSLKANSFIENRFEFYSAILSGERHHNASLFYQEGPGPPQQPVKASTFSENTFWKATARYIGYKMIFHLSDVSVWVGFQSLYWKYNLESISIDRSSTESVDPVQAAISQIFLKTLAPPYVGSSKSESIEIGLMKCFDISEGKVNWNPTSSPEPF